MNLRVCLGCAHGVPRALSSCGSTFAALPVFVPMATMYKLMWGGVFPRCGDAVNMQVGNYMGRSGRQRPCQASLEMVAYLAGLKGSLRGHRFGAARSNVARWPV